MKMHCRAIIVPLILLGTHMSLVRAFVLMESDSNELDEGDVQDRIMNLVRILQKVKELTDPEIIARETQDPDPDLLSAAQLIDPVLTARLLAAPEVTNVEKQPYIDLKDLDIRTLVQKLKEAKWPVDKSYERVIDIQKKDFAILPPSSEWCRMMGFRRCRNGGTS